MPTTSEQAEIFMQAIMGIRLWESDGSGRGETEGEVVGYNTLNGANYGGSDGPLPPGARAAFVLAKGGWQRRRRPSTSSSDAHARARRRRRGGSTTEDGKCLGTGKRRIPCDEPKM